MLSLPTGALTTAAASAVHALHSDAHRQLIAQSHQRSRAFGLGSALRPVHDALARPDFSLALEENHLLYQYASPVMETLYEQIANTHSMVLLTSRRGLILRSLGDADFLEKAQRVALLPGVDWSEQSKGTNAIGTALTEERSVVVHGSDHYLQAHRFLTCSCTPIFDPGGQVMGALDVTGDERSYHQHTMALVRMSAQMIENHLFAKVFPDALRLHFHARLEFLNTLVEGIVVFSMDGRFMSANRSAQFQLGLSFNALQAHTFSSLFLQPVSHFFDGLRQAAGQPIRLCMHNGVSVFAQTRLKPAAQWQLGACRAEPVNTAESPMTFLTPPALAATPLPTSEACMASATARASLASLHELNTGDPQVAAVLHKLQRVQGSDIPILLMGETGTGKDMLARAIHNDSPRARRAFVSINCASIPETLIESELFGYEEGAFTGAKRRGAPGKIQMAHGGTLFLDEIGDMPTPLQARLLRVLQERSVTPLGSGKEYEVDVMLVCATHRNLKALIAQGQFRQDLYYRLNGLVLRLPALRERSDFAVVAQKILLSLSRTQPGVHIAPEVMDLFLRYRWPGNIRQLHNLLRTACVMVGAGGTIRMEHLPDDFLEELQEFSVPDGLAQPQADKALDFAPPGAPALATSGLQAPSLSTTAIPLSTPLSTPSALTASLSVEASHPMALADPARIRLPACARLQDVALQAMSETLRQCKGNVSVAAKLLGVSRNTIYRKKDLLPPDVWG